MSLGVELTLSKWNNEHMLMRLSVIIILCGLTALTIGSTTPVKSRDQLLQYAFSIIETSMITQASSDDISNFYNEIRKAYKVENVDELKGRLAITILYKSIANEDICLQFAVDEIKADSAASAIKVVILLYYQYMIENHHISPNTLISETSDKTLEDHIVAMIRNSSNTSANALLKYFDMNDINEWCRELGFSPNRLHFGRYFGEEEKARHETDDNIADPRALLAIYYLISQQDDIDGLVSAQGLYKVRNILSDQGKVNTLKEFNDRINAQFPKGVTFMHKTGANDEVIVDAGIVYGIAHPFIIVAFDTSNDRAAMGRLGINILRMIKEKYR